MTDGMKMSQQQTLPPRSSYADMPHAYDPVAQRRLFDGVLGKRFIAFLVDAVIVSLLVAVAAIVVLILGVLTLSLGWFLFPLVFPVVGLGYNAVTIGGPNSATIGQRLMGLEVRMWFGGKVTPIVAAFHALLFWLSLTIFCPLLLWPLFDSRKRCLHDILAGVVVINRV
jgi:uncharacterized RDD family membrane protein YckC